MTRTYRPGATIWPFVAWTLIAVGGAYVAEHHARFLPPDDPRRWTFHLIFWGCMVIGPLAFGAHLLRRALTSVTVSPDRGLILSSGRTVGWGSIQSVDQRAAPFRGGLNLGGAGDSLPWGCLWVGGEGCIWGLAIVAVLAIAYYVFLPVLILLSPWQPRVVVRLRNGEDLVFRDLEGDDEFVHSLRDGIAAAASNRA
jgi:hypothetical protein